MDMDGPYYSHRAEKAQDVPWELPLLFPYLLSIQLRYIFFSMVFIEFGMDFGTRILSFLNKCSLKMKIIDFYMFSLRISMVLSKNCRIP